MLCKYGRIKLFQFNLLFLDSKLDIMGGHNIMEKLKNIIFKTNIVFLIVETAVYIISYMIMSAALGFEKIAMMILLTITFGLVVYMNSKQLACEYSKIQKLLWNNNKEKENSLPDKPIIAFHEAGHAIVSRIQCRNFAIECVTIQKVNDSKGHVTLRKIDVSLYSKSDCFNQICMYLAGMLAEDIIYNEHTSGCYEDLKIARDSAISMIEDFAMGKKLLYSKTDLKERDDEAEQILQAARIIAKEILEGNINILMDLQLELICKNTMSEKEVNEFFEKYGI